MVAAARMMGGARGEDGTIDDDCGDLAASAMVMPRQY
jgi:hypothetical protein